MENDLVCRLCGKGNLPHFECSAILNNQSGDIAPIINKAEAEKSLLVSPDWEKEFKMFEERPPSGIDEEEWEACTMAIKSFIQQQIEKATEEAFRNDEAALPMRDMRIRTQLLSEICEKLEGMQFVDSNQAGQFALHADGYNQALEDAIKIIKEIN